MKYEFANGEFKKIVKPIKFEIDSDSFSIDNHMTMMHLKEEVDDFGIGYAFKRWPEDKTAKVFFPVKVEEDDRIALGQIVINSKGVVVEAYLGPHEQFSSIHLHMKLDGKRLEFAVSQRTGEIIWHGSKHEKDTGWVFLNDLSLTKEDLEKYKEIYDQKKKELEDRALKDFKVREKEFTNLKKKLGI